MTTKFMYERDPSGAVGDVLPFSDSTASQVIIDDEAVYFQIPATYSRYIAELYAYPNTAVNNNIAVAWQYQAPNSVPTANYPTVITVGDRCRKFVQGGATIAVYKLRAQLNPGVSEAPVTVSLILYSQEGLGL